MLQFFTDEGEDYKSGFYIQKIRTGAGWVKRHFISRINSDAGTWCGKLGRWQACYNCVYYFENECQLKDEVLNAKDVKSLVKNNVFFRNEDTRLYELVI